MPPLKQKQKEEEKKEEKNLNRIFPKKAESSVAQILYQATQTQNPLDQLNQIENPADKVKYLTDIYSKIELYIKHNNVSKERVQKAKNLILNEIKFTLDYAKMLKDAKSTEDIFSSIFVDISEDDLLKMFGNTKNLAETILNNSMNAERKIAYLDFVLGFKNLTKDSQDIILDAMYSQIQYLKKHNDLKGLYEAKESTLRLRYIDSKNKNIKTKIDSFIKEIDEFLSNKGIKSYEDLSFYKEIIPHKSIEEIIEESYSRKSPTLPDNTKVSIPGLILNKNDKNDKKEEGPQEDEPQEQPFPQQKGPRLYLIKNENGNTIVEINEAAFFNPENLDFFSTLVLAAGVYGLSKLYKFGSKIILTFKKNFNEKDVKNLINKVLENDFKNLTKNPFKSSFLAGELKNYLDSFQEVFNLDGEQENNLKFLKSQIDLITKSKSISQLHIQTLGISYINFLYSLKSDQLKSFSTLDLNYLNKLEEIFDLDKNQIDQIEQLKQNLQNKSINQVFLQNKYNEIFNEIKSNLSFKIKSIDGVLSEFMRPQICLMKLKLEFYNLFNIEQDKNLHSQFTNLNKNIDELVKKDILSKEDIESLAKDYNNFLESLSKSKLKFDLNLQLAGKEITLENLIVNLSAGGEAKKISRKLFKELESELRKTNPSEPPSLGKFLESFKEVIATNKKGKNFLKKIAIGAGIALATYGVYYLYHEVKDIFKSPPQFFTQEVNKSDKQQIFQSLKDEAELNHGAYGDNLTHFLNFREEYLNKVGSDNTLSIVKTFISKANGVDESNIKVYQGPSSYTVPFEPSKVSDDQYLIYPSIFPTGLKLKNVYAPEMPEVRFDNGNIYFGQLTENNDEHKIGSYEKDTPILVSLKITNNGYQIQIKTADGSQTLNDNKTNELNMNIQLAPQVMNVINNQNPKKDLEGWVLIRTK